MNTNISFRKNTPVQPNGIVTAYRLTINNYKSITQFLTLDFSELSIKTLEVLNDEPQGVEISYMRFETTKELFMYELKHKAAPLGRRGECKSCCAHRDYQRRMELSLIEGDKSIRECPKCEEYFRKIKPSPIEKLFCVRCK